MPSPHGNSRFLWAAVFSGAVLFFVILTAALFTPYLKTQLAAPLACDPPGQRDGSFGNNGITLTDFANSFDGARAVAVRPDGKILVAGGAHNGTDLDVALALYTEDGVLVPSSFGTGGKVTTPVGSFSEEGRSIALQTDGKILVAGYTNNGTDIDVLLLRYNADGTLHSSFGTGGIVKTAVGSSDDYASAVALQADGKIVVAGYTKTAADDFDAVILRYTSDGVLDTTFAAGGKYITPIGSADDYLFAIAVQPDGKIVAAGTNDAEFALLRLNADGTPDTPFDADGKVTTAIGAGNAYANALAVQADGKLVVAGYAFTEVGGLASFDYAMARYNTNGALDAGFGAGGKVTTGVSNSDDYALALTIQKNGKIVLAGFTFNNGEDFDIGLTRYTSAGVLDTTFGSGGKVITRVSANDDLVYALAVQEDGKLVAAGQGGDNNDFVVVRYDCLLPVLTAVTYLNRVHDDLMVASRRDGDRSWSLSQLDGEGVSLRAGDHVFDSQGGLHASYTGYPPGRSELRYLYVPLGGEPSSATVVDNEGRTGTHTAISLNPVSGDVYITYSRSETADFKLAILDRQTNKWTTHALHSADFVGAYSDHVFDAQGGLHASYAGRSQPAGRNSLYYLYVSPGSTQPVIMTKVDDEGDTGFYTSISATSDKVYITYQRKDVAQDFKLAILDRQTNSWTTHTLHSTGSVGHFGHHVLDTQGGLHASYQDYKGVGRASLRYLYVPPGTTTPTILTEVDKSGYTGFYTSISLRPRTGAVAISYVNRSDGSLMIANLTDGGWSRETVTAGALEGPTKISHWLP